MHRRLYIALVVLAVVAGYPYVSLVLMRVLGTNTVVMTEHDGTARTLVSGPAAPRPTWVPDLPRALTITRSHWLPAPDRAIAGGADLLSHKAPIEISQFYLDKLKALGFDARDIGTGLISPAIAAWLGIEKQILAYREDDDMTVTVDINSPSGLLLRPRLVKVHWQTWGPKGAETREKLFGKPGN